MREYNVKELAVDGVVPTGEIGVVYDEESKRWERNGQRLLCPLSKLVLQRQPFANSFLRAAAYATGWSLARTLAFKMAMGHVTLKTDKKSDTETLKGISDAKVYDLLYQLSRKRHRVISHSELPNP